MSFDVGSEPEGAVHNTIFAHNVWGLENLAHLGKVPPAGATVRTALKMKPELFSVIFFFFLVSKLVPVHECNACISNWRTLHVQQCSILFKTMGIKLS